MYTQPTILPLENGDRLTRQEFERRYEAMPNLKKAELIEGIVYMRGRVCSGFVQFLILSNPIKRAGTHQIRGRYDRPITALVRCGSFYIVL